LFAAAISERRDFPVEALPQTPEVCVDIRGRAVSLFAQERRIVRRKKDGVVSGPPRRKFKRSNIAPL